MPTVKVFRFGEEIVLEGDEAQAVLDEQAALKADIDALPKQRLVRRGALIERMDDAECDAFEAALAALPSRQRLVMSEPVLDIAQSQVRQVFIGTFGEARAVEILEGIQA